MPTNQEHVHLVWPLWSDLRVIPTHGKFCHRITNVVTSLINIKVAYNAINARSLPLALVVYTLVRPSMATSVGNNSVFKSFFEKQKLTRPNFIKWYRELRIVLSAEDKVTYLEHPIPAAPVAAPGH
ncbi:hypothetical protein Tco_0139769 [Tanacetum coccineum]